MASYNSIAVGIDAQPRGLAVAQLSLEDGAFISVDWYETNGDTLESKISQAHMVAQELATNLRPSITTIELPTAKQSSTFMELWGICGAVIAAFHPVSGICEGIVPTSWRKFSGLNQWAREEGVAERGAIPKKMIPLGVQQTTLLVPTDLTPPDLYDSIAIAKAGYLRNQERLLSLES